MNWSLRRFFNRRERTPHHISLSRGVPRFEVEPLENRRLLSATIVGNVLNIQGTAGADTIVLSSGANPGEVTLTGVGGVTDGTVMAGIDQIVIQALDGDDSVQIGIGILDTGGVATNATVDGGAGNDTLVGGDGNDIFVGGAGNDSIDGGGGTNTIDFSAATRGVKVDLFKGIVFKDGSKGHDTVTNIQNVIGSAKNDQITGDDEANDIDGGTGNDHLNGGDGSDVLDGGSGNDQLTGGIGDDTIDGGDGNDKLVGNDGSDTETGDTGNDNLNGGAGDDSLDGGAGNDKLAGGVGDDAIEGGDGNDNVHGDAGNDHLLGGLGNDKLNGDQGDDDINGGSGADSLSGGKGADHLVGHNGDHFKDSDQDSSETGQNDNHGPEAHLVSETLTPSDDLTTATFQVTYTDPQGVDLTTIDVNDVAVSHFGVALDVTGVSVDSSGDNPVATYTVAKHDGTAFSAADNGGYKIFLLANQVNDLTNAPAEGDDIGEIHLQIGGGTGGTGGDNHGGDNESLTELKSDSITVDANGTHAGILLKVAILLDAGSATPANFTITAPDGTTQLTVTDVIFMPHEDETRLLVTFTLPGDGTFTPDNNGTYSLAVTSTGFTTQGGLPVTGADLNTTFDLTVNT